MGRRSTRNLSRFLQLSQVDDALRGPGVSDNIQLVYIVDDLRHLVDSIPAIDAFSSNTALAQATRVSGIELIAPPDNAVLITWMRNDSSILTNFSVVDPGGLRLTNDIVAASLAFSTGGTPRSVVQTGSRAVNAVGLLLPVAENLVDRFPNLLIAPGRVLLWHGVTINTACTFSMTFREIPIP